MTPGGRNCFWVNLAEVPYNTNKQAVGRRRVPCLPTSRACYALSWPQETTTPPDSLLQAVLTATLLSVRPRRMARASRMNTSG
ncbi:hypothetical protein E2C01_067222 [Portunus trituberculatus]|uniref:Uncharacterized protein n=1 Tax=Portunus trituberculatus TaxID=210409 RepID=A0A5B7HT11_PORTR|nr:hypothetical protein [Portunus trituberculatus]